MKIHERHSDILALTRDPVHRVPGVLLLRVARVRTAKLAVMEAPVVCALVQPEPDEEVRGGADDQVEEEVGEAEPPRPLAEDFVRQSELISLSAALSPLEKLQTVLPRLPDLAKSAPQRPLYDVVTSMHAAAWSALRPLLTALGDERGTRLAKDLIQAGLTPPVVHLTAEAGTLTLYDSSMIHRGGRNVGTTPRPILAVHLRENGLEYGMREDVDAWKRDDALTPEVAARLRDAK